MDSVMRKGNLIRMRRIQSMQERRLPKREGSPRGERILLGFIGFVWSGSFVVIREGLLCEAGALLMLD